MMKLEHWHTWVQRGRHQIECCVRSGDRHTQLQSGEMLLRRMHWASVPWYSAWACVRMSVRVCCTLVNKTGWYMHIHTHTYCIHVLLMAHATCRLGTATTLWAASLVGATQATSRSPTPPPSWSSRAPVSPHLHVYVNVYTHASGGELKCLLILCLCTQWHACTAAVRRGRVRHLGYLQLQDILYLQGQVSHLIHACT